MQTITRLVAISAVLICFSLPIEARAESFAELTARGATVGKMTKSQAGLAGWVVTSSGRTYFCKSKVSLAILDAKTLVAFTSSGRMVKVDRAGYEKALGGPDPSIPKLADLKNGHLHPADVGPCISTGK